MLAPSTTTAAADVDVLNVLAAAGGYPHAPPGPKFTTELTFPDLFTRGDVFTCAFPLDGQPPVPDAVVVLFNGVNVPRDPSHTAGWDYLDASATILELYGSWCTMLHTNRSSEVNVLYGCPL